MKTEHDFDWKGFYFVVKISVLFLVLGLGGPVGWHYALSYLDPAPAPLVVNVIPPQAEEFTLSTSTPQRVINSLTIPQVVPAQGKFIAADLVHMELYLYEDGTTTAQYPILTKGKPGTPYETPGGAYSVLTKEEDHFNRGEGVHMPYSMEFYGNYFIHGWPVYTDGTPVASTFSGGCIRLSTEDAAKVYAFADRGTGIFVYDPGTMTALSSLTLTRAAMPDITAASYLVADLDTGDVYAEENAQTQRPIESVTKLMTALVANETIMFDRPITLSRGKLQDTDVATDTTPVTFVVGDLLYPLLMESNNHIADTLAQYYGPHAFVSWMNSQAKALNMASTTFADASGVSPKNISTTEDLYRLAVYLANKKSFVWKITRTQQKSIMADDGSRYAFANLNEFSGMSSFIGGKVGHIEPAQDTMVSVFSMPVGGDMRRVAVIVLHSDDHTTDTQKLAAWFGASASETANTACVSCTQAVYRKISL